MSGWRLRQILIFMLSMSICPYLWAEPDDTQQAWLERVEVAPRWDNVEGAPTWVAGPAPRFRFYLSLHTLTLAPGQSAVVLVPARERLRLQAMPDRVDWSSFEFYWSNGSGLFAGLGSVTEDDGRSLLVAPPGGQATLVRVSRKVDAVGTAEIALFISRDVNRVIAPGYRDQLKPAASGSEVVLNDGKRLLRYWQTDRNSPLRLEVEGGGRIELDSRLALPERGGEFAESYRLYVYLDGVPWRVLDLATVLDTSAAIAVDGCIRPLGRQSRGYLDLPEGRHQLELRSRRLLYLRLLERQRPDDYLFDQNRPLDYPQTVAAAGTATAARFWAKHQDRSEQGVIWPAQPNSAAYARTAAIAQDNGRRQGGLQANSVLTRWAARYPGQQRYQAMAGRRHLLHSFYRDLMPLGPSGDAGPLFAWFPTPKLVVDTAAEGFYFDNYATSLSHNLAHGFFTRLPAAGAGVQEFLLPEPLDSSQLRISVQRHERMEPQEFYLQLDDQAPIRLRVGTDRLLPADAYQPGLGSIGLSLLQAPHGGLSPTLSGPFAARREVAPLIAAGFLELPLTGGIERVSFWRADDGSEPLRVALAYRTGRWFQQSEMGYLGLLETLGGAAVQALFLKALERVSEQRVGPAGSSRVSARSEKQDAYFDLYNQWLPLLRFVRTRYVLFSGGIHPVPEEKNQVDLLHPDLIQALIQQAAAAEQADDWQQALTLWSRLQRGSTGERLLEARSGQIDALLQLGNAYLAKQLLRHDLLYAAQPLLQQRALNRLSELYDRADDPEAGLTLRAAAAVAEPSSRRLLEFAQALAASGRNRFALQVLLALPPTERPQSLLLAFSYAEGWWGLFERSLQEAGDPALRALWQGYQAQLDGDHQSAFQYWAEAGRRGETLTRQLQEGLAIWDQLVAEDKAIREQAIARWEIWQERLDGPGVWRPLPQAVVAHSGTIWVSVVDQGTYYSGFRFTPDRPLKLGVYGPTTLRLKLRPLHSSRQGEPINDWVYINSEGERRRYPIIDNQVSSALRLIGQPDLQAGRQIVVPYRVPAGYHELQLNTEREDLIATVDVFRPQFPLAVLPPLDPQVVHRLLETETPKPQMTTVDGDLSMRHRLTQCGRPLPLQVGSFAAADIQGVAEPASPKWFRDLETAPDKTPYAPSTEQDSTGHPEHQPLSDAAVHARFEELLWQSQQQPDQALAALIQAEELAGRYPLVPGVEPILRRLRRHASWERVRTVEESAGVRLIEYSGWQPEAPALRTRKAMIGPGSNSDQMLSGHDTRVLSMYNRQSIELQLQFSLLEILQQHSPPMSVLVTLDNGAETELVLSGSRPSAAMVRQVGAGRHQIRIRIAQPIANQYLRVQISEHSGDGVRLVSVPDQRSYELATREQPLVLMLEGPARLRIDEWRDGNTHSRYRSLPHGWQRVVLTVEEGRDEALFRVFRRIADPAKPEVAGRRLEWPSEPIPGPLETAWAEAKGPRSGVTAPLPLGGQEDGTWSHIAALVARRSVDDESAGSLSTERFLALGSVYRYFAAAQDTYYRADGRLRIREQGDPTIALRGWLDVRKPGWPVELDLAASLFLQKQDHGGSTESAFTLRTRLSRHIELGAKTSHRPFAALFQRWLSLDSLKGIDDPDQVDHDIYTEYKDQHERGLRLGDRFQYRPWADNLLYADAYLTSNDNLNPFDADHLRLGFGARQFIADVRLGLDYGWFNYFDDDDRPHNRNTQRVRIDLGIDRWFSSTNGLLADLRYQYDSDSGDSSFWLTLAWNRANGRFYRDYRPGDLDFRGLRQRRALERQATAGME